MRIYNYYMYTAKAPPQELFPALKREEEEGREEERGARSPQASEAGVPTGQKGPRDGSPGSPGHVGTFGTCMYSSHISMSQLLSPHFHVVAAHRLWAPVDIIIKKLHHCVLLKYVVLKQQVA